MERELRPKYRDAMNIHVSKNMDDQQLEVGYCCEEMEIHITTVGRSIAVDINGRVNFVHNGRIYMEDVNYCAFCGEEIHVYEERKKK